MHHAIAQLALMIPPCTSSSDTELTALCNQYMASPAHAVKIATRVAESRLTRLLVSKEWPLMCTTSGPGLLVTFCVTLLKPVN